MPRWLAVSLVLASGGCAARPAGPPGSPQGETAAAPADAENESDPTVARGFGWLGIAVGAEGAIAATATSIAILDYKSTRDSGCNAQKVCSADGLNANGQIASLVGWNAGSWVVAAAGLGIGSYLLLTHPLEKTRPLAITLAPSGTTAGLGLGGSF